MTDLRVLLLEPRLETDTAHPPLATRLPECVPPGMTHIRANWWLNEDREPRSTIITDEQAERQYIGHNVITFPNVHFGYSGDRHTASVDGHYGRGDSKFAALTAALHRLADERERGDE